MGVRKLGLIQWLMACLLVAANAGGESACVRVAAKGYEACFPKSWKSFVGQGNRVFGCNGAAPCTGSGGGFPLAGRMLGTITPASALGWDDGDGDLAAFMKAKAGVGCSLSERGSARTEEIQRWDCPYPGGFPGTITYGVKSKSRLFLVQFAYNGEGRRAAFAREAAVIVLSIRATS